MLCLLNVKNTILFFEVIGIFSFHFDFLFFRQ